MIHNFYINEIGETLDECDFRVHPDDKASTYDELDRHLRGDIPVYKSEHRVLCKDGSYKWILDRGNVPKSISRIWTSMMINSHKYDCLETIQ